MSRDFFRRFFSFLSAVDLFGPSNPVLGLKMSNFYSSFVSTFTSESNVLDSFLWVVIPMVGLNTCNFCSSGMSFGDGESFIELKEYSDWIDSFAAVT